MTTKKSDLDHFMDGMALGFRKLHYETLLGLAGYLYLGLLLAAQSSFGVFFLVTYFVMWSLFYRAYLKQETSK